MLALGRLQTFARTDEQRAFRPEPEVGPDATDILDIQDEGRLLFQRPPARNNAAAVRRRRSATAPPVIDGLLWTTRKGSPKMALRVARGLFWLWLVLSVLWIGGVAIVTCSTTPVSKFDWEKNEQRRAAIETIWLGSAIAFVPPAFVLAVGSAMIWAVRGLR